MISPFYHNLRRTYNIHIFRTNIQTERDFNTLERFFNVHPDVFNWSIDLEDIDKVLRIECSKKLETNILISAVRAQGHFCEELE